MIKNILTLLEKSVLKENVPQSTMFKVKFKFTPWDDNKKSTTVSEFKQAKTLFKSVSDLKIYNEDQKGSSSSLGIKYYVVTGICEVDLKTLISSATSTYQVDNRTLKFNTITKGNLVIVSKKMAEAYATIKAQVDGEKEALKQQQSAEYQTKNAAKLKNLPSGSFYLIEQGESRGDEFGSTIKINFKDIFKTLYTTSENEDFFEKVPEPFINLFYNESLPDNNWQVIVEKILLSVLKGRMFIECWEEGTTGIGMDKKKLDIAVTLADAKAIKGLESKGDITNAVTKFNK